MASAPNIGVWLKNFVPATKAFNVDENLASSRQAKELGGSSLWIWDHIILLGSKRPFTFLASLSVPGLLANDTSRVELPTGILVFRLHYRAVLVWRRTGQGVARAW